MIGKEQRWLECSFLPSPSMDERRGTYDLVCVRARVCRCCRRCLCAAGWKIGVNAAASVFFPPVVIKSLVGRRLLSPPKLFPEYMNTLLSFKRNKRAIIWGKREQEERAKPSQTASLPAFVRDQHRLPLPFPSIATNKWLLQLTGLLSVSLLVFVRPDKLPHSKFCPL